MPPQGNQPDPQIKPVPHRIQHVGLLYAADKDAARKLALELAEWLSRLGLQVWYGSADDVDGGTPEALRSCELLLTLGGDGTALRGAHLAAPLGIPLVCVGLGHLSFMAELTPEMVLKQLPTFLSGEYWLEERSMVEGVVLREGQEISRSIALNEVVVGRERQSLVMHVAARINGADLTTYVADAVIVSTATGSTAYSLSSGGPILFPQSRELILIPVAAHMCLLPPLVIPGDALVELQIARSTAAGVSADGQSTAEILPDDIVRVRRSDQLCYFARIREKEYFFRTLKARLYRGDLPGNTDDLRSAF